MTEPVGSIAEGISALMRARSAAKELATASIPWFGRAKTHAGALRSEAIEQVRSAQAMLTEPIGSHYGQRLDRLVGALEAAKLGEKHIHEPAASLAAQLDTLAFETEPLRARVLAEARTQPAWTDPDLLHAHLTSLFDEANVPADGLSGQARLMQQAVWATEAPALEVLAPAMPKQWATSYEQVDLSTLLTNYHPQRKMLGARIVQHLLDGSYSTVERRTAAYAAAVTDARIDDIASAVEIAALVGEDAAPWAKELVTLDPNGKVRLTQATAIETAKLSMSGAGADVATIDGEVDELIRRAAEPDGIDIADWARLRARLFDFGAAERLELGPFVGRDGKLGSKPDWVTHAWQDANERTGARDQLIASWVDQRHLAQTGDDTVRQETLQLLDQWPASRDRLMRQLFRQGVAERLDLQLDRSVDEVIRTLTYNDEAAMLDIARWSHQLDGTSGNAARADGRTRELLQKGPNLSEVDRVRLEALVLDEGVAERLGLPTTLDGEFDYLNPRRGAGSPAWRYQRLWKQLDAGELRTPQDAAERTRNLLEHGDLDDLETLHRVGTAAIDAGGANELGLPSALDGLSPANQVFRGVEGLVIREELSRYAHVWRDVLAGRSSNRDTLRESISAAMALPDDYTALKEAPDAERILRDVFVHGFDLPGAPLRGMEELTNTVRDEFARTRSSARGYIKKWQRSIEIAADQTTTPARIDRMRATLATEAFGDAEFATLYGDLHAIGTEAAAAHGIDSGKLRALLVERMQGSRGTHVAGARARLLLRESLGLETPTAITDESYALAHAKLDIDSRDLDVVAELYVDLIDRQLLAQLLPESAGPSIVKVEQALGAYRPNGYDMKQAFAEIRVQLLRAEQLRGAERAGAVADPVALRAAVAQLGSEDPAIRSQAALDVFTHGYDLPGAPLARMHSHEYSLVRTQQGHVTSVGGDGTWIQQLQIATQDLEPAARVERLRELAVAERGDASTYAEAYAHLAALGDDTGEVGGVPLAGVRDLLDMRLHGSGDTTLSGARGWMRMREAFGFDIAPVGDDVRARVQRALAFDSADRDAAAAAYVELFDRGLLARAATEATPEELARYGELLARHGGHSSHLADELLRLRIEIDPDGALRQLLDPAATPSTDAHDVLAAIEQHPRLSITPTSAERARVLTSSMPTNLNSIGRWLQQARVVLKSEDAAPLGEVGRDLLRRVDVNLERLAGRTPVGEVRGYGKHPDYAEIGRVRSGIEFVAKVIESAEAKAKAATTTAATDAATGVEKLTW